MALIQCPECGRKVSDQAAACPDCGYPIAKANKKGTTLIKIGNVARTNTIASSIIRATLVVQLVVDNNIVCEGKMGEVLKIEINKPTSISLKYKNGGILVTQTVQPNKRYEILELPSMWTRKFALNEIDTIDSGF